MSDIYEGPFGGYDDVTEVVSAAADVQIQAEFAKLLALFPDPADAVSSPHPDFDLIPPEMREKVRTEITALAAAIGAAPDA